MQVGREFQRETCGCSTVAVRVTIIGLVGKKIKRPNAKQRKRRRIDGFEVLAKEG